jgi:lambda repressor-like predicted transcriptional regulator
MQSEEVSMTLKVLRQNGWSIAAMAREFGLNWRTVKRELESEGSRTYGPRQRPSH